MRTLLLRVNPLVLLAIGLLPVLGSVLLGQLRPAFVVTAVILLLVAVLVPDLSRVWWRLLVVGIGALSVTWSTWLVGSRDPATAITAGLRIVVLALPGAVAAAWIDPTRLGDYLAQRLHLPGRLVAAMSAAFTRFEYLSQDAAQLAATRRARGIGPTRNPFSGLRAAGGATFALLVGALRGATTLSVAMDARGFATAHRRSWALPAPWRRVDTAVLTGAVVVEFLLPLVLRLL